jgi:hypothetical protein
MHATGPVLDSWCGWIWNFLLRHHSIYIGSETHPALIRTDCRNVNYREVRRDISQALMFLQATPVYFYIS